MKKKTIGIVGHYTATDKFVHMSIEHRYVQYFRQFGSVNIIDPFDNKIQNIDLLVLPGGRDLNTLRYTTDPPLPTTQTPDVCFEYFDTVTLPKYIAQKVPIFGICRGHQSLCVTFGATLVQHVYHPFTKSDEKIDDLILNPNQPVNVKDYWITNKTDAVKNKKIYYSVNSFHHQIVDAQNVTSFIMNEESNIEILAYNRVFKTVEAVAIKDYPAYSVQWHPERMNCKYSSLLIKKLLFNE